MVNSDNVGTIIDPSILVLMVIVDIYFDFDPCGSFFFFFFWEEKCVVGGLVQLLTACGRCAITRFP